MEQNSRVRFFPFVQPASDFVCSGFSKRKAQKTKIYITPIQEKHLYKRSNRLYFGTDFIRENDENTSNGRIQNPKNNTLQMDQQTQITKPNYKRIYTDILRNKYPEKEGECISLLRKKNLSSLEIIRLNEKIFGSDNNSNLRSYHKSDIFQILDYQKEHNLNNSQLANHFKLSRNTITKWKKMFLI